MGESLFLHPIVSTGRFPSSFQLRPERRTPQLGASCPLQSRLPHRAGVMIGAGF